MPDNNNHGLPDKTELQWKAMFSATEVERQMAQRLLDSGLYQDDRTNPYLVDIRLDPGGDVADHSPLGQLIKGIVDNQPPEGPYDLPGADETEPPIAPTGDSSPEPPIQEPLGKSMAKLLGVEKPPEPPPRAKYFVPPKPAPPSTNQTPISWYDCDTNRPI
jgi:hypothetical protein